MFGLGIKAIMISAAVIAVTGAATAAVVHYKTLVAERAELEGAYALATSELEEQQNLHSDYVQEADEQRKQLQADLMDLARKYGTERQKSENLSKMLARHDLGNLATKKPGLIGNRVNAGTRRMWRSLEESTQRKPSGGSPGDQGGVPPPGSDLDEADRMGGVL